MSVSMILSGEVVFQRLASAHFACTDNACMQSANAMSIHAACNCLRRSLKRHFAAHTTTTRNLLHRLWSIYKYILTHESLLMIKTKCQYNYSFKSCALNDKWQKLKIGRYKESPSATKKYGLTVYRETVFSQPNLESECDSFANKWISNV